MTVAPARSPVPRHRRVRPEPTQTVTAVLVAHDGEQWLVDALDALSLQTRPPDRLVLVDTASRDHSARVLERHAGVRSAVPDVTVLHAKEGTTFGGAVDLALERLGAASGDDARREWLWLLHDDTAPTAKALDRLLEACRRSPSVGVAGPKQLLWDDPRRLRSVGLQQTRTGRVMDEGLVGEPDQGQHDHVTDVLGVGSAGMLVRRDVLAELGGFDPAFTGTGADLDLSWRAHLSGHRVVLVPRATVREAAGARTGTRPGAPTPGEAHASRRRQSRLVSLARCSLLALPFLTAWIVLGALAAAAALLLVKRPRQAWSELADLGVLGAAWRTWGARWRFRRRRRVRRRDLGALFVSRRTALRHTIDAVQDALTPATRRDGSSSARSGALESGPVGDEAEELTAVPLTWPQRAVRHPGLLVVLAATALSAAAWRAFLGSSALDGSGFGLVGGALTGTDTDAAGLWHTWLDSWHGSGLGGPGESAPFLPLLAGATWLVQQLPWVSADASPAGTTIAWLFLAATPLSAWTAYLAGRAATRARWPRAWGALAWACVPTLTTALAGGRLGAVVAHILLPLVVAGFALVLRRRASVPATFGTALAVAVMGAFHPPLLALCTVTAVLVMVFGGGWSWVRGLVLAILPLALVGPWLLRCVEEPRLLLAGPGLTTWGETGYTPWHLALLHPGGPGDYLLWVTAPFVLLGLVGLLRRGIGGHALGRLALLGLAGLALALAAPHVLLARGATGEGPVTPWVGTGLDLLTLALLASAVTGLPFLAHRRWWRGSRSRPVLGAPLALLAVAGLLASAGYAGWVGLGARLAPAAGAVPAVVAQQADSGLANRLLVLEPGAGTLDYRLVGREPAEVARSLPAAPAQPDPLLQQAVRDALSSATPAEADAVRQQLSDLAVGFVGYRGEETDPLVRHLDGTAGLSRLGSQHGLVLWRVLSPKDAHVLAPSRVRAVGEQDADLRSVEVTGAHAATRTELPDGARRLVVAEPPAWARHATVRVDGEVLTAAPGADQPTYRLPDAASSVSIEVQPSHPTWRWVQLGLLALTVFLAVPFGRSRRTR